MAGRNPAEEVDVDDPGSVRQQSTFARICATAGGPVANYLAASLLIFALAVSGWRSDTPTDPMVIDSIEEGSPAARAGLQPGDVVRAPRPHDPRRARPERDHERASGRADRVHDRARRAGASAAVDHAARRGWSRRARREPALSYACTARCRCPTAAKLAVVLPFKLTVDNIAGMADLIRRHSTEGLTGPVGIGKLVAQQAEKGVYAFVQILIAISVALGSVQSAADSSFGRRAFAVPGLRDDHASQVQRAGRSRRAHGRLRALDGSDRARHAARHGRLSIFTACAGPTIRRTSRP